jgi:hypothetical protein
MFSQDGVPLVSLESQYWGDAGLSGYTSRIGSDICAS